MSDIVDYYFKRFKIVVILFYSIFLIAYLISLFEDNTKEILKTVFAIYYLTVVCFVWYYLWNCAKLVGKRPLHYVLLAIFLSIFGPVVTYLVLRKASLTLQPVTKEETDVD